MTDRLAILAGGGRLPALLLEHHIATGQPVCVVTFTDMPQPAAELLAQVPHIQVNLGAVGKVLKFLHQQGATRVVMAGHLPKPTLFGLKPDLAGVKLLASQLWHHDDALLGAVCKLLEENGMAVVGAHQILPDLLASPGDFGGKLPTAAQEADIQLGWQVAKGLGRYDIGQAVIVKDRVVLGVEAIEGTDKLVERCAVLRNGKPGGLLVKVAKPDQTELADLPAIGPQTLRLLADYQFAGVAIEAGHTLLLDQQEAIAVAQRHKLILRATSTEALQGAAA